MRAESMEQIEEVATRYIAQRESGPWRDLDDAELERWLAASTLHRVAYYRLNAAWQEAGRLKVLRTPAFVPRLQADREPVQELTDSIYESKYVLAIRSWRRIAGVLAAVVAVVILAVGGWYYPLGGHRYVTSVGGLRTIVLQDGSHVTLNTATTLRANFTQHERRIDLDSGEAYFEVSHDSTRPFDVYAGKKRVTAIGTRFVVRRQSNEVRVAVTEGTVALAANDDFNPTETIRSIEKGTGGEKRTVLLRAGSTATMEGRAILVHEEPMHEIEDTLSWRNGVLSFHETPLAMAVAEFNRYNTRKIVIQDPTVGSIRIGGVFGSTSPEAFIHLLEQGLPVQVAHDGDSLVLEAK